MRLNRKYLRYATVGHFLLPQQKQQTWCASPPASSSYHGHAYVYTRLSRAVYNSNALCMCATSRTHAWNNTHTFLPFTAQLRRQRRRTTWTLVRVRVLRCTATIYCTFCYAEHGAWNFVVISTEFCIKCKLKYGGSDANMPQQQQHQQFVTEIRRRGVRRSRWLGTRWLFVLLTCGCLLLLYDAVAGCPKNNTIMRTRCSRQIHIAPMFSLCLSLVRVRFFFCVSSVRVQRCSPPVHTFICIAWSWKQQ